jgi:hypothetical protein
MPDVRLEAAWTASTEQQRTLALLTAEHVLDSLTLYPSGWRSLAQAEQDVKHISAELLAWHWRGRIEGRARKPILYFKDVEEMPPDKLAAAAARIQRHRTRQSRHSSALHQEAVRALKYVRAQGLST